MEHNAPQWEKILWKKFKSPLGTSSIGNKFYSMYDLEAFIKETIKEERSDERKKVIENVYKIIDDFHQIDPVTRKVLEHHDSSHNEMLDDLLNELKSKL